MPFANTTPLRREIAARIPDRPFTVRFWDGTSLPATAGEGGPTFTVRSPRAAAHALRAPGQLGLGRAYVSGELEVDDIDAVIALLDGWQPPALDGADKRAGRRSTDDAAEQALVKQHRFGVSLHRRRRIEAALTGPCRKCR